MSKEEEQIEMSECDKDFLKNKILDLEKHFTIMEKKMDKILELLEKDCKKMSDHIDFVENVYDNVKMPFYYVMDKVNYLVSSDTKNILDSENINHNNNS
jgi:vacuolar-type H+-ATPase subunit D/Vma8